MKRLVLFTIFLLFLTVSGCTDENTLTSRLDYFYSYLDTNEVDQFKQGEVDKVTRYIDQTMLDASYSNRFYEMKKEEGIDLFSTEDVVEYYYKYFYLKIKSNEK